MAVSGESDATTKHGLTDTSDVGTFLERPLLIDSFVWTEGFFLANSINPWELLLKNPLIANKLKNFGGIRATLHIKVSLSSSPFYAGLGFVMYNALPDSTLGVPTILASDEQLVCYSQRPKILLSPQDNMGGEMVLPFMYPYNYCPLNDIYRGAFPGISDLGDIQFLSSSILRNFNTVSAGNVTVTTYAWLTDVELTMNTQSTTIQSGGTVGFKRVGNDEYSDSPVSGVASAVAAASGQLSSIPIIGPYMRASEMGFGALAKVASWFGYTNLPVIEDHKPYTPAPFPNFASSEIGHPTTRLSLDPKNELSIDSRVCGLDGTDELAIQSLVTRECYLTTFQWSDALSDGSDMWHSLVMPMLGRINQTNMWTAPMAHVGGMFGYWTGDIEFRFVVQATKFHMGRVRVEYEPLTSTASADSQLVNSTQVFDIADCKDFTVCVPYSQLRQWSETAKLEIDYVEPFGTNHGTVAGLDYGKYENMTNGMLNIYVQNRLSGPSATNTVDVAVFVRGAPNLTFSNPRELDLNVGMSVAVQSSGSGIVPDSQEALCLGSTDDLTRKSYGVYIGESIMSVRQLFHRDNFYMTYANTIVGNWKRVDLLLSDGMFPRLPGSWSTSLSATAAANPYNYVYYSPMSWMAPCFVGQRGSVNWTANALGETASISMSRDNLSRDRFARSSSTTMKNNATTSEAAYYRTQSGESGATGMTLTNQLTQSGIASNVPYYSTSRFTYTNPVRLGAPQGDLSRDHYGAGQGFLTRIRYMPSASGLDSITSLVDMYVSAGHDYNLVYFKNTPGLWFGAAALPLPALP